MPLFRIWEGYSDEGGGNRWEHTHEAEFKSMDEAIEEVKTWVNPKYKDRVDDTLGDEDMAFVEVMTYFDPEGNEITPDKLPSYDDPESADYSWRNEFFQIDRVDIAVGR